MSFQVEMQGLRTYASLLDEFMDIAERARAYVATHGDFTIHESGLIGMVSPAHRDLVAALEQRMRRLVDLLGASQAQLDRAADFYRRVDTAAAGALDATYPPTYRMADPTD